MFSNQLYAHVEKIASTSGKNEKVAIISEAAGDAEFKKMIELVLNPFITFNIAKRFDEPAGAGWFDESTWMMLDDLSSRRLTGNNAKDAIAGELRRLEPDSQELLWRIIKKDLRAGFGESTVSKVWKGLIPTFPYQRCSLPKHVKLKEWNWAGGIISQEKADGMFTNINKENGIATMTTRQGNPLPVEKFQHIAEFVEGNFADNTQTHGEILVKVNGVVQPRQIGNGIVDRIVDGGDWLPGEEPIVKVWDQIPLSSVVKKGKCKTQYVIRLKNLLSSLIGNDTAPVSLIETRIVHSLKEAYQHYIELLRLGKEGTIVKTKEAEWKDSTSKEQVKLKLEVNVELRVKGYNAGNGKNANTFGSLICESEDGLLRVNVSGFTDAKRKEIHENAAAWMDEVITVCSNGILEISPSNPLCSLFLPRYIDPEGKESGADFVEVRRDKSKANTLQEIRDEFASAIERLEDME